VPEGLSATEAGKGISEHVSRTREAAGSGRYIRSISIVEAVLLSIVTLAAAWSGYSASKWSTESALELSNASTARSKANRAFQGSLTIRTLDATSFNAWFTAHLNGDKTGEKVARKRFRPGYDVAFAAWMATNPFTNPNAPKGPQYMAVYRPPGQAASRRLDNEADDLFTHGEDAARNSDEYVRVTVILASVLFIVGISSQFPISAVRYGLVALGGALLVFGATEILKLPVPPS
jgi:hypothetical protein